MCDHTTRKVPSTALLITDPKVNTNLSRYEAVEEYATMDHEVP